jgi:hypothetical protein
VALALKHVNKKDDATGTPLEYRFPFKLALSLSFHPLPTTRHRLKGVPGACRALRSSIAAALFAVCGASLAAKVRVQEMSRAGLGGNDVPPTIDKGAV